MNYLQFLAFFYYLFLALITGLGLFGLFGVRDRLTANRSLLLGEAWLLGSVFLIGELVTLSLFGLYYGWLLWVAASANLLFLLRRPTRDWVGDFFRKSLRWDIPFLLFLGFLAVFSFRNMFPLMDNDSHSAYLWMQKLWLLHHSSIFGDIGTDVRAFLPHLESVPYGLGITLFGTETLFAGMVNLFWRWVVLLLVFGYTSVRFNRWFALAAALMVMLNDHFFYSGVNYVVLLNGAVLAFVFAAVYNFWESRREEGAFRFMLAILFLSQVIATKFQMAFVIVFLMAFMVAAQRNLLGKCRDIIRNKRWLIPLLLAIFFAAFWLIKNQLATGLATFPVLAGKFHSLGWTPESSEAYIKVLGGIGFSTFLKYMNYIFIWPGIVPAKIVIVTISFLPLFLFFYASRSRKDNQSLEELSFWLAASLLTVLGITLACHQDPRYYRYAMGVHAFAAVYAVWFVAHETLAVRRNWMIGIVLILVALTPIKIILLQKTSSHHPSFQDNVDVLLNRFHTGDAMERFFPRNRIALEAVVNNPEKFAKAAWHVRDPVITSAFVLPERPHVGLWFTAMIHWDSYESEELIIRDLKKQGIEWVMDPHLSDEELIFQTVEEFARQAVKFERYPTKTYFNYGFPPELSGTKF